MKTLEQRKIPTNPECPLTEAEMDVLLQYLKTLEHKEYQRVKKEGSGWCEAIVEKYNEFEVAILVEWGVNAQWRDDCPVCIDRKLLSKPEKLLS